MMNANIADKGQESEFIDKFKRDAIDSEVEEACTAYRHKDKKLASEWRAAEGPI